MATRVLVTGAGGFIGHHLVTALHHQGLWVRGVDLKLPEFAPSDADEFWQLDLRQAAACQQALAGIDQVYHLAADMGGIGYITARPAQIAHNDILINTQLLEAARLAAVSRFLFASSACVYPAYRQDDPAVTPLREADAFPAQPEPGYGWEKLFTEQLCHYYRQDYGLSTRIVRFHNVYGPLGTYQGGKEKAPAALCRKVALAADGASIEVWGDGAQTRSFLYIADCVAGLTRLMEADYAEPLNLGTERLVTVDDLVGLIARIAGKTLHLRHDRTKPQGVRGRNSDNTRLRQVLGWEPQVSLEEGLALTYAWIARRVRQDSSVAHLPVEQSDELVAKLASDD